MTAWSIFDYLHPRMKQWRSPLASHREICELLQRAHLGVGHAGSFFRSPRARTRRRPVYPDSAESQSSGGNNIVIEALSCMQPLRGGHANSFSRQLKYFGGWFVCLRLSRRHYEIEMDL